MISMLAAPMPCSANTRAAASNNFSRVSSRVGRVRTLDMRGKSIILQLDTLLYRIAQGGVPMPTATTRAGLLVFKAVLDAFPKMELAAPSTGRRILILRGLDMLLIAL